MGHVSHGMAAPERLPSLPYTKPQQGYVFVGGDGGGCGCGSHCLLSFNINRIVSEYRAFSIYLLVLSIKTPNSKIHTFYQSMTPPPPFSIYKDILI